MSPQSPSSPQSPQSPSSLRGPSNPDAPSSPRARAPFLLLLMVGLALTYAGWRAQLGRLRPVVLWTGLVTTGVVIAILINRVVRRGRGARA